ncbi:MAG: transglycosylase SLT domain-containing protein [Gallionella sp.]|nr:transglycosylase SLT domain-containing protein [Gallionella sp.]
MPLIRLVFIALFSISAFALPALAHAEEIIALNAPSTDSIAPEFLPSAQDVRIELIPEANLAPHDLWQRIRSGFAMRDLDSKLVARHEKWYARNPEYVARMTDRARRYLFYITEEVERRGMPSEIALLPMIESAFNPGAYSVSRASGIWQFIPSTGKKFGMQQNWWYDGRRDVLSATNGALDYLQNLHDMFGDWELALAAYNCGEGGVKRAQARNHQPEITERNGKLRAEVTGYQEYYRQPRKL